MLEEFNDLVDAMLVLKKQGQLNEFISCCDFDAAYNILDYSKAKLKAAISGLDDSAYKAIDEFRRLDDGSRKEI